MRSVIIVFSVILLIWCQSCHKSGCEQLWHGVYQYPSLPKHNNMTKEQVDAYFDLPSDVASCISTSGLIQTCLNYPSLSLIHAGANLQSGYDLVKSQFLGLRVLEGRADAGENLLKSYQARNPLGYDANGTLLAIGYYTFHTEYLEVMAGQDIFLNSLTADQKVALVKQAMKTYDEKLPDVGKNQSQIDLDCTATILARLMYNDQFQPFLNLYSSSMAYSNLVGFFGPSTFEATQKVRDLSASYLLTIN